MSRNRRVIKFKEMLIDICRKQSMPVAGPVEIRSTKEMFIVRALEKILSDRDIRRSHHAQLKRACEVELGMTFSFISVMFQYDFPKLLL